MWDLTDARPVRIEVSAVADSIGSIGVGAGAAVCIVGMMVGGGKFALAAVGEASPASRSSPAPTAACAAATGSLSDALTIGVGASFDLRWRGWRREGSLAMAWPT